jgi:hypothetical protein
MIVKKLKSLLKPPVLSLLLNGGALGALALLSRVSAWGTFAWVCLFFYVYKVHVSGRGMVGWSFVIYACVGLCAIRGVADTESALLLVFLYVALITLFISAISYRVAHHDVVLHGCRYIGLGLFVLWWTQGALLSACVLMPFLFGCVTYVLARDAIRFHEHVWDSPTSVWYGLFAYVSACYLWGISALSLAPWYGAALFLVWYVLADDAIFVLRTGTITKYYMYEIVGWYIGASMLVILMGILA